MREIQVKLFGNLQLQVEGQTINIENQLGKSLSSLFAYFVVNRQYPVTKETLIKNFWSDSDNPASALKYAIFRLRGLLSSIEGLEEVELIKTVKNGYQFTDDIEEISVDTEIFENLIKESKRLNNRELIIEALTHYTGNFLDELTTNWIHLERGYYSSLFFQNAAKLAEFYVNSNNAKDCMELCNKALAFDALNEDMIYYYIKSLIMQHQYNTAMQYYNKIKAQYLKELGVDLNLKDNSLFSIISKEQTAPTNENIFTSKLLDDDTQKGGFVCDYTVFKKLAQFNARDAIRTRTQKYIVIINTNSLNNDQINQFIDFLSNSVRLNDVISKINKTQVAMLVSLTEEKDIRSLIKRVVSNYSTTFGKELKLSYSIKSLVE